MLALVGGTVMPVTAPPIERGTLLVAEGRIQALGGPEMVPPPDTETIDVSGRLVLPGFIDAHTHAGHAPDEWRVADMTTSCSPEIRIIDGLDADDPAFAQALTGGVTTVAVLPGSKSLIGGQVAAVKVAGRTVEEMLLHEPIGIKIAWGATVRNFWSQRAIMPSTRMAMAAMLRAEMQRAREYRQAAGARNLRLEALAGLLAGRYPARVHCYRAEDIRTVAGIAREYGFDLVLEHATDAHLMAADLAERNIATVLGPWPHMRDPSEARVVTLRAPGILSRAGVRVAFMSDYPIVPIWSLPIAAALAVREGMAENEALKALTIHAAQILGVAERVGSLAAGKDADVVVWSGHPFDWRARVEMALVNGQVVYRGEQDSRGIQPC